MSSVDNGTFLTKCKSSTFVDRLAKT